MKRFMMALGLVAALVLAPGALAAGRLHGVYKTKITGDKAQHGALNGTWVVDFTKGHYAVAQGGHPVTHGKDTIKDHTITLTDTGGKGACQGTGHYKFKLSGNTVKFTKIKDAAECTGRMEVLKHTFTKAS